MSAAPDSRRWPAPFPAALSAALAIILYAHTLGGTWIYDDLLHARDDGRLADVHLWSQYWTKAYVVDGVDSLYRPLVSLSYAIQWKLGGGRAWPFHAVNILLHAGAGALVAELARRLTGRATVALIAGLLFAAHPVHVEGVAYIVGRAESACAVGTLGALVLALRPLTRLRAFAIFGCVAVAVLCKEQGLLAPLLLLALWPARRRVLNSPDRRGDERGAAKLLFVVTLFGLATYTTLRERVAPWTWDVRRLDYPIQPMMRSGGLDRALIPVALVGRAVALMIAPVKLTPDYGVAIITSRQDWADPYLYFGAVCVAAALTGVIVAARRRAWGIVFLLLASGLTYALVSNVSLIGVVFAERLLYQPSAFLLILAAIGLCRFPSRVAAGIAVVLIGALSLRTVTYAARWNDRLVFYEQSLADNPRSLTLHVLLASELIDRGRWDEARGVIERAKLISADFAFMWLQSARVNIQQGRLEDAWADLDRVWAMRKFGPELFEFRKQIRQRAATRAITIPARDK